MERKEKFLRREKKSDISYDPSLLVGLNRFESRRRFHINLDFNKFYGLDSWTAYELSWLEKNGLPKNGILYFSYSSLSKLFLESKSVKLYLNSLNNKRFQQKDEIIALLEKDFSNGISDKVNVEILDKPREFLPEAVSIDNLDIGGNFDLLIPNSLDLSTSEDEVEESLCCDTFRSLCPLSGRPDWASIRISYKGRNIIHKSLLVYLISFRNYQAFHEECVEKIFQDLFSRCEPSSLTVQAYFMRRGGVEINPVRSTEEDFNRLILRHRKQ